MNFLLLEATCENKRNSVRNCTLNMIVCLSAGFEKYTIFGFIHHVKFHNSFAAT